VGSFSPLPTASDGFFFAIFKTYIWLFCLQYFWVGLQTAYLLPYLHV